MATSVFDDSPLPEGMQSAVFAQTGRSLTAQDVGAMFSGALSLLGALHKVYPSLHDDELLAKAKEIESCPAAVELLHMVWDMKKIRVE